MNHSITKFKNQDYSVFNARLNKRNSWRFGGQSMRTALILIFAMILKTSAFSQHYIYVGEKKYIATSNWNFKLTKEIWSDYILGICVAKTQTGGLLVLTTAVPFTWYLIGGPISIFLSDGTLVNVMERVSTDNVDENAISIFRLNKTVFEKMKALNIEKVRFDIKVVPGASGGGQGSYTAKNENGGYSLGNAPEKFDTAKEISALDDTQ